MALPEALRSRLTWEQYLQTPESMERVEIEDGKVKPMACCHARSAAGTGRDRSRRRSRYPLLCYLM